MQNILLFIFRLYGGGAERVVSNLSSALSQEYNVKIAIFDKEGKTYPYSGELLHIKLPFSEDPVHNAWWQRMIRLFVLVYELRKLKKRHKIDIAVSFGEPANIINVLSGFSKKTVVSVRTILSKEISTHRMWITRMLSKLLYNKANSIVVPSDASSRDLVDVFHLKIEKIKIIPNFIEQDRISTQAAHELANPFLEKLFKNEIFLNVGRVTPAKGQWLLLELMTKEQFRNRGIKLVIVGESESEGKLKSQLLEKAASLGLNVFDSSSNGEFSSDHDVFFLGFQSNPYQFMKRSKLLLFPSLFEGFPNTVLEAMQCELPVIVADCNSITREILSPRMHMNGRTLKATVAENGILCPSLTEFDIHSKIDPALIEEWIKGIELLEKDMDLRGRLRQNALTRVKDYNKASILSMWKQCIKLS
jgi:glycosyltransferase involved in cell wall biosynthesis